MVTKVYNEKLWEEYVKKYPEKFIDEKLIFFKQQDYVQSGIIDLVFKDTNNKIILVELQLNALDRDHFAKSLEYKWDLEKRHNQKNIRIILLCNSVEIKRAEYVKMYQEEYGLNIDVKIITEDEVKKIIRTITPNINFVDSKEKLPSEIRLRKNWEYMLDKRHTDEITKIKKEYSKKFLDLKANFFDLYLPKYLRSHCLEYSFGQIPQLKNIFDSNDQCFEWYTELQNIILKKAYENAKQDNLNVLRAPCPLCNEQAVGDGWSEDGGYTLPRGLIMHLKGEGRTRECKIFNYLTEDPIIRKKAEQDD